MGLASGMRLGAYEVLGPLGAGGMGEVYRASDTRLRREVAVKVLPEAFTSDEARMKRGRRWRWPRSITLTSRPSMDSRRWTAFARWSLSWSKDRPWRNAGAGASEAARDKVVFVLDFFSYLRRIAPTPISR